MLVLDLVQEDVAWFEGKGSPVFRAARPRTRRSRSAARALFGGARATSGTAVTNATDTALTLRAGAEAPVMRMTGVPRADVIAAAEAAGGRVVAVFDDPSSGREWRVLPVRRGAPGLSLPPPILPP